MSGYGRGELQQIIDRGNYDYSRPTRSWGSRVRCADGFEMSVLAGAGAYCKPRPGWYDGVPDDYPGPYTAVEVGYPSVRPEPWAEWEQCAESPEDPTGTVYGCVPVEMVRELVALHGGEA